MFHYNQPITANFIITRNCNSNCIFCGVEHKSLIKDTEQEYDKILEIIDKLDTNNVLRINFFGGEPLMYPKILDAISYAKSKGIFTSLVSNGLNITESMCSKLKGNLDSIGISLHGLKEEHESLTRIKNSFDKTIKNIQILNKYNIPVSINMTVTKNNYKSIEETVDTILKKCKIEYFAFNRCIPNSFIPKEINEKLVPTRENLIESLEIIDKLSDKYKNIKFKYAIHFPHCIVKEKKLRKYIGKCGFGQNYISIDKDGNIQLCSYTNKILGNIFENNLKEIWESNKEIQEYRSEKWLPNKCISCEDKNICMAGCKVSANKGFFAPDILIESGE